MKKLFSTIFFGLMCFLIHGQTSTGGPDNFGYTYKNSNATNGPSFQWFDISQIGTFIGGLADDNFSGPYNINGFNYYGTVQNHIYIGSNGYVAFDPINIASSGGFFTAIPNSAGGDNFIAPFLTDLTFAGAATNPAAVYLYDQGDTTCITFEKVPFWVNNTNQYDGLNTFQVILNRADTSITFNYKTQVGLPDPAYQTNFLSIGIENQTGLDGLQYFRGSTFPPDSFSVKFEFPATVQPFTDIKLNWALNEKNGGKFISPFGSLSPSVNIENIGNQDVSTSFSANYFIEDPINSIQYAIGSVTIDSLNVGEDTTINFTATSMPPLVRRYNLKSFISGVNGDVTTVNDTINTLLKVIDTTISPFYLDYSEQTPFGAGISWNGGNAGVGVYIEPPYYPVRVVAANFYITNLGTPITGFHSVIYDDDARGGGPGTVLDSTYIPPTQIFQNAYNRDSLRNSFVINSGGVYLMWKMGNGAISLGRGMDFPASRQSYEVLGGVWSPYRDAATEDFLMNLEIEPLSVNNKELTVSKEQIKVYPSPAKDFVTIQFPNKTDNTLVTLLDINGRKVQTKLMDMGNSIRVYKGNLSAGTYLLRIDETLTKKIIFTD